MTKSAKNSRPNSQTPLRIHRVPRAHLIGAAGAGMRSLATVMDKAGWDISGSDLVAVAAPPATVPVRRGHTASSIDADLDVVVYSDAIPHDNVELAKARHLGVPTLSYPQMLGRLMESRQGIAVSGTHGKSTTTAMTAEILRSAGLDPTFVLGAEFVDRQPGGCLGHGRWMVAEACEYRENFLHLRPEMACILGIELDHVDCFESLDAVRDAFARFAQAIPSEGLLLAHAGCATTAQAARHVQCARETFGLSATADWHATGLRARRGYYSFCLRWRGRLVCQVQLQVPGKHNVINALAAAALASHAGATGSAMREGLARFTGLRRRLETLPSEGPLTIVDDYAHHPTEVQASLATVREMFPGRRVCCVFQPHQASRTQRLLDEFARSLQNADTLVVTDVFRAREPEPAAGESTAADLAARVRAGGQRVVHPDGKGGGSPEAICRTLRRVLRPDDVLVTLGAGDIGNIAHEFGQGLRTFRQAS